MLKRSSLPLILGIFLCLFTSSPFSQVSSLKVSKTGRSYQVVRDFGDSTGKFEDAHDKEKTLDSDGPVTCQNEQGSPVDWFIVYKLPKTPNSMDSQLSEGSAHYVLLPGADSSWKRSAFAINDSRSTIGRTVQPLSAVFGQEQSELAAVLYNDQPPNRDPTIKDGHTKGLMLANSKGGYWLPHSIPHFPIPSATFAYPPGGLDNGQMLLCISLSLETLDQVFGGSLQYTKATFYNSTVPDTFKSSLATVLSVIEGKTPPTKEHFDSFKIQLNELTFSVLAKGPKFHREIYADWIAPKYNVNLDVQSWLQGTHKFLSNCTSNCTVLNVMEKSMLGQNFSYSDDHSKWAVSQYTPLTCIADLNRSKPQKGRGGVALCVENKQIWKAFKELVVTTQPCNATKTGWNAMTKNKNAPRIS